MSQSRVLNLAAHMKLCWGTQYGSIDDGSDRNLVGSHASTMNPSHKSVELANSYLCLPYVLFMVCVAKNTACVATNAPRQPRLHGLRGADARNFFDTFLHPWQFRIVRNCPQSSRCRASRRHISQGAAADIASFFRPGYMPTLPSPNRTGHSPAAGGAMTSSGIASWWLARDTASLQPTKHT